MCGAFPSLCVVRNQQSVPRVPQDPVNSVPQASSRCRPRGSTSRSPFIYSTDADCQEAFASSHSPNYCFDPQHVQRVDSSGRGAVILVPLLYRAVVAISGSAAEAFRKAELLVLTAVALPASIRGGAACYLRSLPENRVKPHCIGERHQQQQKK